MASQPDLFGTRHEFSKAVRRIAYNRCGGLCEACGLPFKGSGDIEYHHGQEAFLGGAANPDNCRVVHRACHRDITVAQRPVIDKVRRLADARMGIRRKVSRPLPGTRASGLRKRMDGTVEKRP